MSFLKTVGLVFSLFISSSLASFSIAKSDIIHNGADTGGYWLNSRSFFDYPKVPGPGIPGDDWVDLGICGPLNFTAAFEIGHSFRRHTLTVWLKRDGVTVATESTKKGPSLSPRAFTLIFPPVDFSPGEWTIGWQFLSDPVETVVVSIKLIAPIIKSLGSQYVGNYTPNYDQVYCSGQPRTGDLCFYRPKPPTGFINNNSYHRDATITSSTCPLGQPNGPFLCSIARAPRPAFVRNNSLYFPPVGHGQFLDRPPLSCPARVGYFPNYYPVTKDYLGCFVLAAPYPQQALALGYWLYLTSITTGTCPGGDGNFDGFSCYIRSPPSGSTAREISGNWYWTPRYCN
jgi:hypothetical protein